MRLCYQVATPDVAVSESVTAYQGSLEKSFSELAALGYDGVELMTLDPGALDWQNLLDTARQNCLGVALVCTGELFGQLKLSFADADQGVRREAVERVKAIIDFASFLDAKVNIGRVRGQYLPGVPQQQTREWCSEALRTLSDYAATRNVTIALETVTILQTNFINTLEEGVDMLRSVDRGNCALMMDVFHLNLEEADVCTAIKSYAPYNVHVHLADNNRRYPGNCGLNFDKIIEAFKESGYNGDFCTEIFQLPSMEAAAAKSIAYLAPIFERVYGRRRR